MVWTVLWLVANALLRSMLPDLFAVQRASALASMIILGLSMLLSLIAGWLTARISGRWRAIWILIALQLLAGLVVTLSYWQTAAPWYHVLFLVLLVPLHLSGAYPRLQHTPQGGQ